MYFSKINEEKVPGKGYFLIINGKVSENSLKELKLLLPS